MASDRAPLDPKLLVRAIAHELTNPVSGLVGAVELLQSLGPGEAAKRRRYVDLSVQTVAKLEEALKDLRHAAVAEGGPVRALDEAVARAVERGDRPVRLELEEAAPVLVTVGPRLEVLLDRWIEALEAGPASAEAGPVLRIVRPHRFGVWLQSGPIDPGRGAPLGEVGGAGARLVEAGATVTVFFPFPLERIRA